MARKRRYHQGVYQVKYNETFVGDSNPTYRSSWERAFMHVLDGNESIKAWGSENIVIPYLSPLDNAIHRYFVDFAIEFKNGKQLIVEIKPYAETQPPNPPPKRTKKSEFRYQQQVKTYLVNQAKWTAAEKVCKKAGAQFEVWTENELRKFGIPI